MTSTSSRKNSLRHRVARALYEDGAQYVRPDWDDLPDHRQAPWLGDADRVIPIVVEACAMVADQSDPEKPTNYLFRRENIGSVMKWNYDRIHTAQAQIADVQNDMMRCLHTQKVNDVVRDRMCRRLRDAADDLEKIAVRHD